MTRPTLWPALTAGLLAMLLGACSQTPSQTALPPDGEPDTTALTEPQRQLYEQALGQGKTGDYQAASDQLARLVQQRPHRADIWLHLATAYYHNDALAPARKALENALQLDPSQAAAYNLAGTMATAEGDIASAEKHFKAALKENPESADAHYNLALLYDTYYQDLAPAIEHYRRYLSLIPQEDKRTAQWVRQLERALERLGG